VTISETLAEHVARTGYDALPASAVRAAKASLVDTLAVAIAARAAPGVAQVAALASADGGRPASTLWTAAQRVPPRAAAFTNAVAASALDFDSLHHQGVAHADIVVVPSAVGVAEDRGVSGKDLLAAIAVGDDVLCRLCLSTQLNSGWFYTSLYGPIASAAVTAKLLGGDSERIAAAMGLASMSASGTQQPAVERSMGKRMQGALAASAGVTAGYLAMSSIDGPRQIVEGAFGLYAMHESGDAAAITRDIGVKFEGTRISFKAYPSCQCNHAAIEGTLALVHEFALLSGDIERVDVTLSPYMQRLVGSPFDPAVNPQVAAQFSIRYSIAAVFLHGRFGIREITDEAILDPRIRSLVERIHIRVDAGNQNKYAPVTLTLTTRGGQIVERTFATFAGAEDRPLTDDDLTKKLTMCIEAAEVGNAAEHAEYIFDAISRLEQCADVTRFMSAALERVPATG
jgi:2-methylcitrate dehydratase PrpD